MGRARTAQPDEPECDLVQEHQAARDGARHHRRLPHLPRHQERLA